LPSIGKRLRTTAIAAGAAVVLGAGLFAGLGPAPGVASSHREAPLVAADPQVDATDLYAFVSPDKTDTVTLISNWIPFEEPAGGPNFYPWADGVYYDINIDNDGDAKADLIYRWVFHSHYRNKHTFLYNTGVVTGVQDKDLNFHQTYNLTRIDVDSGKTATLVYKGLAVPSDVGAASMPDYRALRASGVYNACDGKCQTVATQADDPFFLDLRVFDLLYGANFSEVGHDTLRGFSVNTIALRVPSSQLAQGHDVVTNPIIGVWTTAERQSVRTQTSEGTQSFSGPYVQVSRLGSPLVNEVVIPVGLKDRFNASLPQDDGQFASYVLDPELPHLINAVYGLPVPDCDNDPTNGIDRSCDLVPVFLTGLPGLNQPPGVTPSEELRLNMSIPPCTSGCSRLGVIGGDNAGFPNGRRLSDDVIDIALQVTEGLLINGEGAGLGDGVDGNGYLFSKPFPYLGLPVAGSSADPHALRKSAV
jgi:hypothetical protein